MADPLSTLATPATTPTTSPLTTPTTPSLTSTPTTPASPTTSPNPVDAYMNPFTSDVLTGGLKALSDTAAQAHNTLAADAFHSGAYGDARDGVADGTISSNLARDSGNLTAQTNATAYDTAMGWLNTDTQRQTDTALANAGLDNQYQANQLAAMGLGNTMSQQDLTNQMNYTDALKALDTSDTATQQNKDNVAFDDWMTSQGYDASQLSAFLAAINGSPTTNTTTTTTPPASTSYASGIGSAISSLFGQ